MVSTPRLLTTWLRTRSPDERRLLLARVGFVVDEDIPPQDLARLLLRRQAVVPLVRFCTLPQRQALAAVAWLAAQRHGPLGYHLEGDDPASRAVPRADVLDLLAGPGLDRRTAADAVLDELAGMALVLPPHGDQVIVPGAVHMDLAGETGLGRPAAELLAAHFNPPEVHAIAEVLGFPNARVREVAERNVLGLLGDPERVRALVAGAPASVRDWLLRLVGHGSRLRTHAYQVHSGYGYQHNVRYVVRPGGSGDPATDWLVAHGLLLPAGPPDVAEVPFEVATAVLGGPRVPFTPDPPPPPDDLPGADGAEGTAQAAATSALSQIERLLAACVDQPPTLRKAGGLAVRDTRRIAKAAGVGEDLARFWIDLATQAELLGLYAEPVPRPKGHRGRLPEPMVNLLPTTEYDTWLKRSPVERLARIIGTWATLPATYTHWPAEAGTPVALTEPSDPHAVSLRYALLEALAAVPPGKGLPPDGLPYLMLRAAWHRPHHVSAARLGAEQAGAILREAGLLGVTAGGALTAVGHAVRDLLVSGEAWRSPEAALTTALSAMLPPAQATARFQADLTAVVPGMPDPSLAELLDGVAERESEGHAVVWRLSAATVRRAFDQGYEADDLLARLSEAAEGPLPQTLEYLVKDTARVHGRIRVVRSGCCLRADDEALIEELARAQALRALGLRKIAPTVLISAAGEEETLARLRAAGYAPALESETGATVVERAGTRRVPARS